MKVLYLASNPMDQASLALEREITELRRRAVASSGEKVEFVFLPELAFEDIPGEVATHRPDILHISAHGTAEGLEIAHGNGKGPIILTSEILCAFLDVDPPPKLVYLSACESVPLAQELVKQRVPMAIGTTASISNRVARQAAVNFYARLLDGKSVKSAFEIGRMIMKGHDPELDSQLVCRPGTNSETLVLHTPSRILAKFFKNCFKPVRGTETYKVLAGVSGCPGNTVQVVFFTTATNKSDVSTCCVCHTAKNGEIWMSAGEAWARSNESQIIACIVSAAGDHFSVSSLLSEALERYYVSTSKLNKPSDMPDHMQRAITDIRGQGTVQLIS